jgi:multisubunit Na+/H+ antiporter MnhG subunit
VTAPGRGFVGFLFLIALVAGGAALLKSGAYGLTVFVVAPVLIGALAPGSYARQQQSKQREWER